MTDGVLCSVCAQLLGCPHLEGSSGKFDENLVVRSGDLCPDFTAVSDRERIGVRTRLFELSGLAYLRVLHGLPQAAVENLRIAEEVEQMYEAVPDFQDPRLLWEGMPADEREYRLTYETDEEGNVIIETDEEGNEVKRRRPNHHLTSYVINAFEVPTETALLWSANQLISHILKEEKRAGWITRATKNPTKSDQEKEEMTGRATVTRTATPRPPGGVKPPPRAQPPAATQPSPAAAQPPPAPGGRVARPPVRPGAKPATPAAAATAPAAAQAPAAAVDTKALVAEITKAVEKKMEKQFKAIAESMGKDVATIRDELAVFHDLMISTKGSMWYDETDENGQPVLDENGYPMQSPLPTLSEKPSKLSAHLDGTAYAQAEG